jgi:hypothetical protein
MLSSMQASEAQLDGFTNILEGGGSLCSLECDKSWCVGLLGRLQWLAICVYIVNNTTEDVLLCTPLHRTYCSAGT